MSVRSVTFYQVMCDFPGCKVCAQDGDVAAWATAASAVDDADGAGWWMGVRDVYHYCTGHRGVWEADLLDGVEPEPEKPYLLHRENGESILVQDPSSDVTAEESP